MATGRGVNDKAGNGKDPKVADFDELVDEVLAKKGPAKYTDGLSEDNWESVSYIFRRPRVGGNSVTILSPPLLVLSLSPLHLSLTTIIRSWNRFPSS